MLMKTHYVTIKEGLLYTSCVCQDPIFDFPDDIWPEEGVESQPFEEEQEEKVAVDQGENVALQKFVHRRAIL
jgi:hypothetical protein